MTTAIIIVPLALFIIFVAPLWLFLHYRSKRKTEHGLSSEDYEKLEVLSAHARKLSDRVANLERILDSEAPSWRRDYER